MSASVQASFAAHNPRPLSTFPRLAGTISSDVEIAGGDAVNEPAQPAAPPPARDEPTDVELVRAAAAGDDAAFESLYRRHRDWVACLALRFTREEHMALDVTQETFIFLAKRIPTLTLTAKLTTYLYPVVRSIAATHLQKRGRHTPGGLSESDVPATSSPSTERTAITPTAAPERAELDAKVRRAVDGLPEGQREAVLMRFVSDMSLGDIAIALGVPLGTVKSRLHGAIGALRAILGA